MDDKKSMMKLGLELKNEISSESLEFVDGGHGRCRQEGFAPKARTWKERSSHEYYFSFSIGYIVL